MIATVVLFSACKEDDKTFPEITAPSVDNVVVGTEVELSFEYTAEAGFKSSQVEALNGTATVTTDGETGAKGGTIVVNFTAGNASGAASVTLTVTDELDKKEDETAIITVVDKQTLFYISENVSEDTTWETGNVYIL